MPSAAENEHDQLSRIEDNLAELTAHVNTWLADRFLADDATPLNLEDVSGLILWLQQWQIHFDGYTETAKELAAAGLSAVGDRLAQIRGEIDNSIAQFTEMAAGLMGTSP